MKVGQTFTWRKSGWHTDCILVIRADEYGVKYLYNIDLGCRQGEIALLNAKIGPVLTRKEFVDIFQKVKDAKGQNKNQFDEARAFVGRIAESMGAKFVNP